MLYIIGFPINVYVGPGGVQYQLPFIDRPTVTGTFSFEPADGIPIMMVVGVGILHEDDGIDPNLTWQVGVMAELENPDPDTAALPPPESGPAFGDTPLTTSGV